MTLLIGTDEAGYGPNLGPLMVAATVWRVDARIDEAEAILGRAMVAVDALAATGSGHGGSLWADSKQVYRGEDGFVRLERAVSVGLALAHGAAPVAWHELAGWLGPISPGAILGDGWRPLATLTLPRQADADACGRLAEAVRDLLAGHGVVLERVACRGIYPDAFNASLDGGLNKSDILSAATLDLAADVRSVARHEEAIIGCDRHGGRKRYGGLVARHFESPLVQALEETSARSAYLVPAGGPAAAAATRIEFCVGGEAKTPVALASMVAKYVRELAMHAFNTYWCGMMPGLRPTAGYPTDAVRWRRDAAAAIERSRLAEDSLWRRA